ncbi:MAG: DUF1492 domain-containing protein [Alistipes sp.]|nr:DUF1492 domain-containing protein [Alistipes sp.]
MLFTNSVSKRELAGAECFLLQYRYINRKVEHKYDKLSRLNDRLSIGGVRLTDMPKNPSPSLQPMADTICEMIDLEHEIAEILAEAKRVRSRIIIEIAGITDCDIRRVLDYYYLHRMKWLMIAERMNCSESRVYEIRDEAIRMVAESLRRKGELEIWMTEAGCLTENT